MEPLVKIERYDGRAELVLNRPSSRNALTGPMVGELLAGLNELVGDSGCRTILLRGAGGYFCAGLDLKALAERPRPDWVASFGDDWAALHAAIYECPKPIVGAIERFAIAGGSALAYACDLRIVGKGAFVHVSEMERGTSAPINTAWLYLRYGFAKAQEVVMVAERLYGEELLQRGLAANAVADSAVLDEARLLADRLAVFEPAAVMQLKASLKALVGETSFEELVGTIRNAIV